MIDLPGSRALDIGALSSLFSRRTNSYKFLFFLALLENLDQEPIPLRLLGREMLVLAWYPHTFFRLSFGTRDQMGQVLDNLDFHAPASAGNESSLNALRVAIDTQWEEIGGDG